MAVPARCSIASSRANELKSCPSTSPTHPGSGNHFLPGMPPLLRRKGRFPQAGQERREQRGNRATLRSDSCLQSARAKGMPTHRAPAHARAGGLASFVHGVLLNTGPSASSAWGHTGRVRGGPRPPHVPSFANPRRPRGGGPGTCIRRRGGIEPLRVSTPHELKSCPSTSPTHPGPPVQTRGRFGSGRRSELAG